ncbi:unnamed protein product [Clavelina lepadiformis]|uniref:LITAF domain-containing protein n=1 Tax=Clavelina lepadiformis TaxID=159417 RepID=A0ABP0FDE0_CLALP
MNNCGPPAYCKSEGERRPRDHLPSYEEAMGDRWVIENMDAQRRLRQEIAIVPAQLPTYQERSMTCQYTNNPPAFANARSQEVVASVSNTCFRPRRNSLSWLDNNPAVVTCPACNHRVITNVQKIPKLGKMFCWLVILLLFITFPLWIICAPCVLDELYTHEHYCSSCKFYVGNEGDYIR